MTDNTVAGVAVEGTAYNFDGIFDYAVSPGMSASLLPGCRVKVPFGRGNRPRQGMVMYINNGETKGLKTVASQLDSEPVLNTELIKLADFMHRHYFCTYYDAVKAMLPAGINYRITYLYKATEDYDSSMLRGRELSVFNYLSRFTEPQKKDSIVSDLSLDNSDVLDSLCTKCAVVRIDEANRTIGDKSVRSVRPTEESMSSDVAEQTLTGKQQSVMELLLTVGEISVREICYYTGVTQSVVNALVTKGLAEYFDAEVFRKPQKSSVLSTSLNDLNTEQEQAYLGLHSEYSKHCANVSLLYGITGSGKTSVYLKLIKKVYDDGLGVIVMVPEIALTPQLASQFCAIFGENVAVVHSGLSLGERLDEFKRIKRGLARIVVGTRSAVFAPVYKLGLIIMDEEQEHTYKSEGSPRFHARELAKFRCSHNNCMLLLSSATPDVESYYYAKSGRYSLFTIGSRFGEAKLPEVTVADMNVELTNGNNTGFSDVLLESLESNINKGRQSIILLNRRGYNTFAVCRKCREVLQCPNCSISLTYHAANGRMMCHYCGYSKERTEVCPACGSHSIRFAGSGTQKAEQTLTELLPGTRVLRLDTDSVMTRNAHSRKLSAFANGEYDILVGTQMVAKGLDFPNVTLVGVLNADQMLYSDDYRSYERAFSMLTQVVGRSGRGDNAGRAIIQTFTPENTVIALAAAQDYDKFYSDEIVIRKAMLYPPFADLLLVGFIGADKQVTINCANAFLQSLTQKLRENYCDIPIRILGPSPALVSRVSNKFRYKMIIKCRMNNKLRELISDLLCEFGRDKRFAQVTVLADAHPASV